MITCKIYVGTCEIYVSTCEIYVGACEIYVGACEIYEICSSKLYSLNRDWNAMSHKNSRLQPVHKEEISSMV